MKLDESFYQSSDVTKIAKALLGKVLVTRLDKKITSGLIVETEAYSFKEKGCHAYNSRMTTRNKVMFESGGLAYVYLCYGIHNMFNVVTNLSGSADAILIRALEPMDGHQYIMERMKLGSIDRATSGPGKLTKALGIDRTMNGLHLSGNKVWIEDQGVSVSGKLIKATPRIGIDYAEEDALLPWRFALDGNRWVSKP